MENSDSYLFVLSTPEMCRLSVLSCWLVACENNIAYKILKMSQRIKILGKELYTQEIEWT